MAGTIIIYYSHHHENTKKLVEAIKEECSVDLVSIEEAKELKLSDYSRIGFASGIYYAKFAPRLYAFVALAENVIGFILTYGAPKEIRVSNILVESALEQICEMSGTKLRRVKQLPILLDFIENAKQYM